MAPWNGISMYVKWSWINAAGSWGPEDRDEYWIHQGMGLNIMGQEENSKAAKRTWRLWRVESWNSPASRFPGLVIGNLWLLMSAYNNVGDGTIASKFGLKHERSWNFRDWRWWNNRCDFYFRRSLSASPPQVHLCVSRRWVVIFKLLWSGQ